jgi:hypothetical protein
MQLDYDGTITKYKTTYPDIKARLDAAIRTWGTREINAKHSMAADAANRAKLSMECTRL